MTTPNIGSGVVEHAKPKVLAPGCVFRFEGVISGGSSVTTPIFDTVPDGWPYTELEVGSFNVVRVPSRWFRVYILIQTTVGMQFNIFHVQDNGSTQPARNIYIPLDDAQGDFFEWVCPGRRCQFRLSNSPFATAGVNSDTRFEIVSGGSGG